MYTEETSFTVKHIQFQQSPLVSYHAADAHTEPELAYCLSRCCLLKRDASIFFATTYMQQRKANNVTSQRLNNIFHEQISISIFCLPFLPLRLMLSKKNYCVFVKEFFSRNGYCGENRECHA